MHGCAVYSRSLELDPQAALALEMRDAILHDKLTQRLTHPKRTLDDKQIRLEKEPGTAALAAAFALLLANRVGSGRRRRQQSL